MLLNLGVYVYKKNVTVVISNCGSSVENNSVCS